MKLRLYPHEHTALLAAADTFKVSLSRLVRSGLNLFELKPEVLNFIKARVAEAKVEKNAERNCSLECKLSKSDRERVELYRNGECVSDFFRKNFGFKKLGVLARSAGLARRAQGNVRVFNDQEIREYETLLRDEIAGKAYEEKRKGEVK